MLSGYQAHSKECFNNVKTMGQDFQRVLHVLLNTSLADQADQAGSDPVGSHSGKVPEWEGGQHPTEQTLQETLG